MRVNIFVIALSAIIFTGCKSEQKKDDVKSSVEEIKESTTFDVKLDVVIKQDDDLILYYKDGTNQWIVEEKAVWANVKGKEGVQTVTFNLPENIVPNDFRLDIGRNEFKGQDPIEIKSFTMSYFANTFTATQDEFNTYFKPNQYITYNPATKQYELKKDEQGNYDGFFETTPELYPKILNLVK